MELITKEQEKWVNEVLNDYVNDLVYVGIHGSKLYGIDHKDSDTDIKVVYTPELSDILMGKDLKPKQEKCEELDIEMEIIPVTNFLKSLSKADTNCIDMLHTPDEFILYRDSLWENMRTFKSDVYSKSMKGLMGYIKTHVHKYSHKIERLNELNTLASEVFKFLHTQGVDKKVSGFTKDLDLTNLKYTKVFNQVENGYQQYLEVCGKKYIFTWNLTELLDALNKEIERYGKRTQQGMDKNMDTKALSHALRVLYQVLEILEDKTITFPLKERDIVYKVKMGQVPLEDVLELLDTVFEKVNDLIDISDLPEKSDITQIVDLVGSRYSQDYL